LISFWRITALLSVFSMPVLTNCLGHCLSSALMMDLNSEVGCYLEAMKCAKQMCSFN
jgi:hypothetical protein